MRGIATCAQIARTITLISTDTQRIGYAIDVVEPRGNQSDLQDRSIIKSNCSQTIVISSRKTRGIAGQLAYVIEHKLVLL